jgi:LemA protein
VQAKPPVLLTRRIPSSVLAKLEDAIQNARRYYNAVVRDLNTSVESFPGNLVAGLFDVKRRDFFELGNEAERSAPRVSFGA